MRREGERWREKEGEKGKGGREGGREGERAGQWLVDILPGPKPQTDREKERGMGEDRRKGDRKSSFLFLRGHFC